MTTSRNDVAIKIPRIRMDVYFPNAADLKVRGRPIASTNSHRIFEAKERKNNLLRFAKGFIFRSKFSAKMVMDSRGKARAIEKIMDERGTALTTFTMKTMRAEVKYVRRAKI